MAKLHSNSSQKTTHSVGSIVVPFWERNGIRRGSDSDPKERINTFQPRYTSTNAPTDAGSAGSGWTGQKNASDTLPNGSELTNQAAWSKVSKDKLLLQSKDHYDAIPHCDIWRVRLIQSCSWQSFRPLQSFGWCGKWDWLTMFEKNWLAFLRNVWMHNWTVPVLIDRIL